MKRYALYCLTSAGTTQRAFSDESGAGDWVRYEDAAEETQRLNTEITLLVHQVEQLREALAACEKRAAIAEAAVLLADQLRNRERGLPPDVITVQAQARILDWEGSRGIVTPANGQGKDESK